jgi:hypothetical protein
MERKSLTLTTHRDTLEWEWEDGHLQWIISTAQVVITHTQELQGGATNIRSYETLTTYPMSAIHSIQETTYHEG